MIVGEGTPTGLIWVGAGLRDCSLLAVIVCETSPYRLLEMCVLQTVSNTGEIKSFHAHSGDDITAVTFCLGNCIDIAQHIR